jgi:hypothetical protein
MKVSRIKVYNFVVVELAPASARFVLNKGDVVTATKRCAEMPDHRVRVVDEGAIHCRVSLDVGKLSRSVAGICADVGFLLRCHGWFNKGRDVEALKREVDWCADLSRRLGAGCREAFEVNDKCVRSTRYRNLLDRLSIFLTPWTAPQFVACQPLWRTVTPQTVPQFRFAVLRNLNTKTPESFIGRAGNTASLARKLTSVLACKHATNDAHVAMLVTSPLDHGGVLARKAFAHDFFTVSEGFKWRLVPGDVEVFVHVVKNELEEFLGVLLRVYAPLRVEVAAYALR